MTDHAPVVSTTEARQASPRRLNFRVLVVSMGLAVVVAAILYYAIYAYPQSAIGIPETPSATTEPSDATVPPAATAPESVTPADEPVPANP